MHKSGDGIGILAREFLDFVAGLELEPNVTVTAAEIIAELRRAFYAGANIVIGEIDEAPDHVSAAEAVVMMKTELLIMAIETLQADLALHEKEKSDAKPPAVG